MIKIPRAAVSLCLALALPFFQVQAVYAIDPAENASPDKHPVPPITKIQATAGLQSVQLEKLSIAQLQVLANEKYWSDDFESARTVVEEITKRCSCALKTLNHECLENYMNLAVCDMEEQHFDAAIKLFDKLLIFAQSETTDTNGGMDMPDCLFFKAECEYRNGSYKQAELLYSKALAQYQRVLDPYSPDLSPCIEGLAGCYYRAKNYEQALPLFKQLVRIEVKNHGPDDVRTAWTLFNLADVLNQLGKIQEAHDLFEKSVYIFRKDNLDRLVAEYKSKTPDDAAVAEYQKKLRPYVFGKGDRPELNTGGTAFKELVKGLDFNNCVMLRPYNFYNWRLKRIQNMDAPGLVTMDPEQPLKGLIICVHGLGLHHGTYSAFAKQMAARGFGVVAFDVRGFGTYKAIKGYDQVDLDTSVKDLGSVLRLMRRDYPDTTVFLLGESMGGALALHVAARYPDEIDALISSVPSGSRFGATKTKAEVATHLLINKNRPFDIGKDIVHRATHMKGLQEEWSKDPEARLQLSALELVQFQKFMDKNLKCAAQLKEMPVIIFHGYGDKLVKPEGTLALYNALQSKDKDLVFVGHAEHLIFEEGQFKLATIDGVTGWLTGHLRTTPAVLLSTDTECPAK